jgi:hypothetical protein
MTQEDKELLLKDLCARLPYGMICTDSRHGDSKITEIDTISNTVYCSDFDEYVPIEKCNPYLRPMSSMTKEEMLEYSCFVSKEYDGYLNDDTPDFTGNHFVYIEDVSLFIDWLNESHFDHRGLIPKGLAIEVTEENNPYK